MQINIEENQKEIKEHGSYSFPLNVAVEHIESYEQGCMFVALAPGDRDYEDRIRRDGIPH